MAIDLLVAFAFIGVIFLNVLLHKWFIKKALRKYIIPKLAERELHFVKYTWCGFFNTGDFEEKRQITLIVFGNGSPAITELFIFFIKTVMK